MRYQTRSILHFARTTAFVIAAAFAMPVFSQDAAPAGSIPAKLEHSSKATTEANNSDPKPVRATPQSGTSSTTPATQTTSANDYPRLLKEGEQRIHASVGALHDDVKYLRQKSDAPLCPPQLSETDLQALKASIKDIEHSVSEMAEGDSIFFDVFVSILSSRIENMLFGEGGEKSGLIAIVGAWLVLAVSIIKLVLAWYAKERRVVEVLLSFVLCISSALGVVAVTAATNDTREKYSEAAARTNDTGSLESNQDIARVAQETGDRIFEQLSKREAAPQQAEKSAAATPQYDLSTVETKLDALTKSNAALGDDTKAAFASLEEGVQQVLESQVGFIIKLVIFLSFCGIAFVAIREWEKR